MGGGGIGRDLPVEDHANTAIESHRHGQQRGSLVARALSEVCIAAMFGLKRRKLVGRYQYAGDEPDEPLLRNNAAAKQRQFLPP
jgi:hypothetical protein